MMDASIGEYEQMAKKCILEPHLAENEFQRVAFRFLEKHFVDFILEKVFLNDQHLFTLYPPDIRGSFTADPSRLSNLKSKSANVNLKNGSGVVEMMRPLLEMMDRVEACGLRNFYKLQIFDLMLKMKEFPLNPIFEKEIGFNCLSQNMLFPLLGHLNLSDAQASLIIKKNEDFRHPTTFEHLRSNHKNKLRRIGKLVFPPSTPISSAVDFSGWIRSINVQVPIICTDSPWQINGIICQDKGCFYTQAMMLMEGLNEKGPVFDFLKESSLFYIEKQNVSPHLRKYIESLENRIIKAHFLL
jgi:hypothetical protein